MGGPISGWAYILNNIFVGKWMSLYPGELKIGGGGFKVGFYGMYFKYIFYKYMTIVQIV